MIETVYCDAASQNWISLSGMFNLTMSELKNCTLSIYWLSRQIAAKNEKKTENRTNNMPSRFSIYKLLEAIQVLVKMGRESL